MHGRPAALTSLLVLLTFAGNVRAHRLEADYRVLPDRRVQVESWFDLTGESPKGAQVQVFADGQLVAEGKLDEQGLFVFGYEEVRPLKVIVSAGMGHRKELTIPAAALAGASTASGEAAETPGPFADRSPRVSVRDILAGVGLLLAVAAFFLSLRNARALRNLKKKG